MLVLIAVVLALFTGCSQAPPLDIEVAKLLAVQNNSIADLSSAPSDGESSESSSRQRSSPQSSEKVDVADLLRAVNLARTIGTDLRIVIVSADAELVDPAGVVSRFGGTALSFKANENLFQAASADIASDQVIEAVNAARSASSIEDSAEMFVNYLHREGIQRQTSPVLFIVAAVAAALAAVFFLYQMLRFIKARKRSAKNQKRFNERKASLHQWAIALRTELDKDFEAAQKRAGTLASWHELDEFCHRIIPKTANASTQADLDAGEMQLGRAYIKLREMRERLRA